MGYRIISHDHPANAVLRDIAAVWNTNASGRHAFLPWTAERLAELVVPDGYPVGTLLTAHIGDGAEEGRCIAFAHVGEIREDGYPHAASVEMLLVDAAHRGRGLGTALLQRCLGIVERYPRKPALVDALGAWPFGYAFNCLADGSERSGVFLNDPAAYRIFRREGFEPVRKSIVMRADLIRTQPRPIPPGTGFHIGKRTQRTWLDRVFRGRELWDHELTGRGGQIFSRGIFGFMEDESRREGRAIFSLFGVNTPFDMQGKGYAGINLSRLMEHVRDLGGDEMELHVYADNTPAVRLYTGLGFKPLAETMMMHKPL